MNQDETQVVAADSATQETVTETTVDVDSAVAESADPIDAIEDITELRKIAKAQRSIANRYKNKPAASKPPIIKTEEDARSVSPRDLLRAEEFRLYRQGYDEDEIDLIVRNGGSKILEDKNNPISLGLQARRAQREAERAAAQTSGNSGVSEVERKYTVEQLNAMSSEELAKILPHA